MPDHAVTWLFVPGDRPQRFATAAAAGADAVILDLEDAVAAEAKELARGHVAQWLAQGGRGWVRINASTTPWYDDDLTAVGGLPGLAGVVVPKAEQAEELQELRERLLPGAGVVALVESALGLYRSLDLAAAADRLAFGSIDFAADLGAEHTWDALLVARSTLVLSSRLAGIAAPIDGVTTAVRDEPALAGDVAAARSLGFTGKLCIHPAQVHAAAAGFAPSPADLDWARRVVAAVGSGAPGALTVDGAMVDRPIIERAHRILRRSP
ncbi:MAG: CoA ester lyase [Austwickia sp.]|nr:CoA ester lyase [Austwickia sp.]MBK8435931.1 CoA ester lyase [Austwickia sp.]MBK9101615.1 CoA ester lyase [Austwickia sp.]